MRRLALPVAVALDDGLASGVGQAIESAVAQYGILEQSQQFFHRPVAGDNEAGGPASAQAQVVEIGRLLGGEPVQSQVVQGQQVRSKEGPEGALQGVVTLAWFMTLK